MSKKAGVLEAYMTTHVPVTPGLCCGQAGVVV